MTSCSEYRDRLSAFLDGEAGDDEATIRAHLATCPACRQTVDGYRGVSARLREVAGDEPAGPFASLSTRLHAEASRRRSRQRVPRFAVAAVAVAALLWTVVLLGNGGDRRLDARWLLCSDGLAAREQRLLQDAPPTGADWLAIVLGGGTQR